MHLSFNLAPSNRDLKDPTTRQNFDDMVEQKRVIDLRACLIILSYYISHIDILTIQNQTILQIEPLVGIYYILSNTYMVRKPPQNLNLN